MGRHRTEVTRAAASRPAVSETAPREEGDIWREGDKPHQSPVCPRFVATTSLILNSLKGSLESKDLNGGYQRLENGKLNRRFEYDEWLTSYPD